MDTFYFQYDKCDSNDPMCAMLECGHSPKSFQEIAKQMKCQKVLDYLDKINKEKVSYYWVNIFPIGVYNSW